MPKKVSPRRKLTRRQLRDLDIEINFLEGVVARDPKFIDALRVLGDSYTRRSRFADGLKIDQRLARRYPRDPFILYNLCCSYALTKKIKSSAHALLRALDHGYCDFALLKKDPDLANLRRAPIFEKILAHIERVQMKMVG